MPAHGSVDGAAPPVPVVPPELVPPEVEPPEVEPLEDLLPELDVDEPVEVAFAALTINIVAWLMLPRIGSHTWYKPTLSVTVSRAVLPLPIAAVRLGWRPVPMIASACERLPMLTATNVSFPGVNVVGETSTFPSRSVTLA